MLGVSMVCNGCLGTLSILLGTGQEVKAGKAEAQELAWKSTQVSMIHISLALRCKPSLAISWPTHSFFFFLLFF